MKKETGIALSEFGLLLALVVVAAIGALALLGGNVSKMLGNAAASAESKSTLSLLSPQPGNAQMPVTAPVNANPAGGGGQPLPQQISISLDAASGNISKLVTTAGSNGATNQLADSIKQIAGQLLAKGEVSQVQYNALIDLANKGHQMAAAEKYAEDTINQAKQDPGLLTGGLTYDGQSYSNVYDLAMTVGFADHRDGQPSRNGTYLQSFVDQFNAVVPNLQDPAVRSTISVLSEQIKELGNNMEEATGDALYGSGSSKGAANFQANLVSGTTHLNSNSICTAARAKVAEGGTLCQ